MSSKKTTYSRRSKMDPETFVFVASLAATLIGFILVLVS
jgi:hypothetical protein